MPTNAGPALMPTEAMNSTIPVVCNAAGSAAPKCPNTSATRKIAELPRLTPQILTAPAAYPSAAMAKTSSTDAAASCMEIICISPPPVRLQAKALSF